MKLAIKPLKLGRGGHRRRTPSGNLALAYSRFPINPISNKLVRVVKDENPHVAKRVYSGPGSGFFEELCFITYMETQKAKKLYGESNKYSHKYGFKFQGTRISYEKKAMVYGCNTVWEAKVFVNGYQRNVDSALTKIVFDAKKFMIDEKSLN
ncbi:hypothetical protein ACFLZZ_01745 [Nanoarchaeota archaeon]